MKVSLAAYGRLEPQLEVRLSWGVGETWNEAHASERAHARRLGVPVDYLPDLAGSNGWQEWARSGMTIPQSTLSPTSETERNL